MKLDLHQVAEEIARKGIVLPTNKALSLIVLSMGVLEIHESRRQGIVHHLFIIRLSRPTDGWPEDLSSCQLKLDEGDRTTIRGKMASRHWGRHFMLLSGEGILRAGTQVLLGAHVLHDPTLPCDNEASPRAARCA
jgi:hypothetical protein